MSNEPLTSRRVWALIGLVLLLVVAGFLWGPELYRLLEDREAIQDWVAGFGPWGPLLSILLNTLQVLLAPIPGQTLGLVNGYLYGVLLGTLYSLVGVMLGSLIAMTLGRWFGRPLVGRLVGPDTLERWDRVARRQGPAFFFLIFLFPFFPDDVICFMIGLSPLAIPYMLLLAALGRLPGLVVASWVGAYATSLPWWGWVLIGAGGVVLAVAFWRYQEQLEQWATALIERLARRR